MVSSGGGGGAFLGLGFRLGFALFTFFFAFFFAFFGKISHLQVDTIRCPQNIDKFWVFLSFENASLVTF